jgi:hypothetical protein
VTTLPDWLVERAALDEVPAAMRARVAVAPAGELAARIAALGDDGERELARFPAEPAVAQLVARADAARRRADAARRRRITWLAAATTALAALVLVAKVSLLTPHAVDPDAPRTDVNLRPPAGDDGVRVKGAARLVAYRQTGGTGEQLAADALCHDGDVLQLRYHPGSAAYGVIASLDGAGGVTLHFPLRDDAPPEATAVSPRMTSLPESYTLDDAPRFERFFFITSASPIDVSAALGALRELSHRDDAGTAQLELPDGQHQTSLRLLKPDRAP